MPLACNRSQSQARRSRYPSALVISSFGILLMPYKYLDDVGTADIAVEATGRDLAELFRDAADATVNVMIDNVDGIQPRDARQIELANDQSDRLLVALL